MIGDTALQFCSFKEKQSVSKRVGQLKRQFAVLRQHSEDDRRKHLPFYASPELVERLVLQLR